MTTLKTILDALAAAGEVESAPRADPEITGVADDSRRVSRGFLFCAIEGTDQDGHRYVDDARRAGAAAALVSRPVPVDIPQVVVRRGRRAASVAARTWYGNPAAGLVVVAVTGTNGKSTTVALVRHLLNDRGTVASVGTLGVCDGAGPVSDSLLTTPGAVELHALLDRLRRGGVETLVMEASSHGIEQGRLEGVPLRVATYTNLTHDHLDYHGDLARYRAAKMKLSDLLTPAGIEVVNADDPAWTDLPVRAGVRRIEYGRSAHAAVRAVPVEVSAQGSQWRLHVAGETHDVRLPLLGDFNVTNAAAAAAVAWGLGLPPGSIAARLADAPQIAGRMERLASGSFTIVRDYAHTPDALARVIAALRHVTPGRLIVLFGAGGDRDRAKRPEMGRIASAGADIVYLTSDNPRTEDPERILDDIREGMRGRPPIRIADRREAIQQAVASLEDGDCLVLAGKGHELYQVVGTERRAFDEAAIVRDLLRGAPR